MLLLGVMLGTLAVSIFLLVPRGLRPADALVARWLAMADYCEAAVEQHRMPTMTGLISDPVKHDGDWTVQTWIDAGTSLMLKIDERPDPPATLLSCSVSIPDRFHAPDTVLAQLYVAFSGHTRDLILEGRYAPAALPPMPGWLLLGFDTTRPNRAGCTVRAVIRLDSPDQESPDFGLAEIRYFELAQELAHTTNCASAAIL